MKWPQRLAFALGAALVLGACASEATPASRLTQDIGAPGPQVHWNPMGRKPGPALYVLNAANASFDISIYAGGGADRLRTIAIGRSSGGFAVEGSRLYFGYPTSPSVPDGAGSLNILASRGTKLVRTLTQKKPFGLLTFDQSGNLFTECRPDEVCEYADAKQLVIRRIAFHQFNFPFGALATDPAGDLAASSGYSGVLVFAPGKLSPYWTISKAGIAPIAFDSEGNLYAGVQSCCGSTSVEVYPPGSQSPIRTITSGIAQPLSLAFDSAGNLYVLNDGVVKDGQCSQPPTITVYAPGGSTPSRVISNGLQCNALRMLAVDSSGSIYVPNYSARNNSSGNVVVYAAGSSYPLRTVTDGIANPVAVGVGP